jgi:hypothetical protein
VQFASKKWVTVLGCLTVLWACSAGEEPVVQPDPESVQDEVPTLADVAPTAAQVEACVTALGAGWDLPDAGYGVSAAFDNEALWVTWYESTADYGHTTWISRVGCDGSEILAPRQLQHEGAETMDVGLRPRGDRLGLVYWTHPVDDWDHASAWLEVWDRQGTVLSTRELVDDEARWSWGPDLEATDEGWALAYLAYDLAVDELRVITLDLDGGAERRAATYQPSAPERAISEARLSNQAGALQVSFSEMTDYPAFTWHAEIGGVPSQIAETNPYNDGAIASTATRTIVAYSDDRHGPGLFEPAAQTAILDTSLLKMLVTSVGDEVVHAAYDTYPETRSEIGLVQDGPSVPHVVALDAAVISLAPLGDDHVLISTLRTVDDITTLGVTALDLDDLR